MIFLTPDEEAQLLADTRGERGPEWQAKAFAYMEEEGLTLADEDSDFDANDDFSDAEDFDAEWWQEASTQLAQMEKTAGRTFTEREKDAMIDFHGESDLKPNMARAYEEAVGRPQGREFFTSAGKDERQAVGTEAYLEAEARREQADEPLAAEG